MKLNVLAANFSWFLYSAARTRTWNRATQRVRETQTNLLLKIVAENKDTLFGKEHGFARMDTVAAFQASVPVRSYNEMRPYIDKIGAGASQVLTASSVDRFGVTSGSTDASKLIPYTAPLIAEFQAGIDPWMYHLFKSHPRIMRGKGYWSVTPVGESARRTSGGIPIGFDDERAYFNSFTQQILRSVMAAPSELALIRDMEAFRYATLRFLVAEPDLTWMSVWNPSFVTLLLEPLQHYLEDLAKDVGEGTLSRDLGLEGAAALVQKELIPLPARAKELGKLQGLQSPALYQALWPNLALVSCWTHGSAGRAVEELKRTLPFVLIEPKGVVATEAMVSFPFHGRSSSLALTSHFFEFEDLETKEQKLADELIVGRRYVVIVTTSGGLYRYRLGDVIEVVSHHRDCPLIEFKGREGKVFDLYGEKLNEGFVEATVTRALAEYNISPSFWMVAPYKAESGQHCYTLLLQGGDQADLEGMVEALEGGFKENYHYEYCRRLGQLGACQLFHIAPGVRAWDIYLTTCTALGQRLGDIKNATLHPYEKWPSQFEGEFVKTP